MKYEIEDDVLTVIAEDEHDSGILSTIWMHPVLVEYEHAPNRFMEHNYKAKLVFVRPKRKEVE